MGKKVSGIKRHISVDTQGLPHVIHVTTANIGDRAGATEMFEMEKNQKTCELVEKIMVDGGYTGEKFKMAIKESINAEVEVAKRNALHKFEVIPKRWVVERSFAWLDKCRRLWKNCERLIDTSIAMVKLAFISLLLRRR